MSKRSSTKWQAGFMVYIFVYETKGFIEVGSSHMAAV